MDTTPVTVLAIEDDPTDAVLLRRYLESIQSFTVDLLHCSSSIDGLSALMERHVDVVLLDYMLGAETGLTTLSAIRQSGHTCPVIFLTGQGDERVAVDVLQAGASDYLPKSAISTSSLERSISNALEKARLKQLIERHQDNLKAKNTTLEDRNREISAFYHTLSHELKTPLTSIHAFLSIVLDGLAGELGEKQREYLDLALAGAEQMRRCVDDLVDVTRLETGKVILQRAPEQLSVICRDVVTSLQSMAQERGVELSADCPDEGPAVEVDKVRIVQVLNNLIGNALKFTPREGRVTVSVGLDASGHASVSVKDTGRGIPAEHLARIFDRLHQVKQTDYSTAGGMGLGLHLCRELVVLHGGQIEVESKVGKGSEFRFTIPLLANAQKHGIELGASSE